MTSDYQSGASAMRRFRHKKRGTTYKVIGVGQIQSDVPLTDSEYVVIYQSEDNGHFWARRMSEFEDGRFEEIPADPTSNEGADADRLVTVIARSIGRTTSEVNFQQRAKDVLRSIREADMALPQPTTVSDARDAEIAMLRASLDPFADCVNEGWAPDELKDDDVVMVRVKHHQGYTLKVSDFRRAAAIKQAETK